MGVVDCDQHRFYFVKSLALEKRRPDIHIAGRREYIPDLWIPAFRAEIGPRRVIPRLRCAHADSIKSRQGDGLRPVRRIDSGRTSETYIFRKYGATSPPSTDACQRRTPTYLGLRDRGMRQASIYASAVRPGHAPAAPPLGRYDSGLRGL